MEGQLQTSFIPKRPLVQKVGGSKGHKTNVFLIVMVAILATIIALAVGLFFYQKSVESHNADLQDQLTTAIASLQPKLINDLTRLDSRIESTKTLLSQHVALSSFFDFLAKATLPDVRFSSFNYSFDGQKINIVMNGQAKSFSALAIQAQTLAKPEYAAYIQGPSFANFNLDKSGNVVFDFKASLDPASYLYSKKFAGTVTTTNTTQTSVAPVSTTTPAVATTTGTTTKSAGKTTTTKTH